MIRRDDGTDWLLIAQADHAHLSGEVATVWGNDAVPSLPVADLLVPAIRDHDEGWRDWERAPKIDPETGRPIQFTEMPLAESTAIWTRSIAFCGMRGGTPSHAEALKRLESYLRIHAERTTDARMSVLETVLSFHAGFTAEEILRASGPGIYRSTVFRALHQFERAGLIQKHETLIGEDSYTVTVPSAGSSSLGGLWVSQHFCWLAEQAKQNRTDPDDFSAIDTFLSQQETLQQQWRAEAAGALDDQQLEALIRNGFRFVQFFDRLSLWLCCAPRSEPHEIGFPVDQSVQLIPKTPSEITLDPWPLSVDRLELSVPVRRIPARPYTDEADLQATLQESPIERLHWTLTY